MKRRSAFAVFTVLAVALASVGVLHAITNGMPDGNRHPYVGALVFPDTGMLCSGSLIAPDVVLTAGHCTAGATQALWYTGTLDFSSWPPAGGVSSTDVQTHPDFGGSWQGMLGWEAVDVGIVVLAAPQAQDPASLPAVGLVDSLPMKTPVEVVGYGVQYKAHATGKPAWWLNGERYYAPSQIVASENLNSEVWLKLTASPGQGKGGICFGDSGGPDLLGNTILATNSFVTNGNCTGVTYGTRVDRDVVLEWVNQFLP
jgi:hypothetical protein